MFEDFVLVEGVCFLTKFERFLICFKKIMGLRLCDALTIELVESF